MANDKHIPLSNYFDEKPLQAIFTLQAIPILSCRFQFGVPEDQGMVGVG